MSTLDITPDVSLFHKLGRVKFTIATALAEFIDNSIDSRRAGLPSLVVQVSLSAKDDRIVIIDNSGGLSVEELRNALTIGWSPSSVDVMDERIGENGFGLKAAATFLAKSFELVTRKVFSPTPSRVVYDRDHFVESRTWSLPFDTVSPDAKPQPGTKITLTNLNVDLSSISMDELINRLAVTYSYHLEKGHLTLYVNDTKVTPATTVRLPEPFWPVDLTISGGRKVTGWVGARSPLDVPGNDKGGFDLIYKGRVIRSREWVGYRWTGRLNHMVGQLHFDDFEVNNNKTDFIRDTPEWVDFERKMEELLDSYNVRELVYKATRLKDFKPAKTSHSGNAVQGKTTQGDSHGEQQPSTGERGARSYGSGSAPNIQMPLPTDRANQSPSFQTRHEDSGKPTPPAISSLTFAGLHPRIRMECEHLYRQGHIRHAVREAFDVVNRYVREKTGIIDDHGTEMMWLVFHKKPAKELWVTTRLQFNDLSNESEESEQDGLRNIFAGVQMAMRNVFTHGKSEIDPEEALECLALASMLCRKLDTAKVVPNP